MLIAITHDKVAKFSTLEAGFICWRYCKK